MTHRLVLRNASELCVPEAEGREVQRLARHAVYAEDGLIRWIGPEDALPPAAQGAEVLDAQGGAVLPGLVDCHTHLVYAGDRVNDFALRARGETYASILAQGGGIHTTVNATRSASFETLLDLTRARLRARLAQGITTTEIKSGYGLTVEHELRMLRVVKALREEGFDVEGTLLAAHVVPKDTPREDYITSILQEMIPAAAQEGLARFVDVFVEKNAYTAAEAERIFEAASLHGLRARVHAEQLTNCGGSRLAARIQAASADHLECASERDLAALAEAKVVGVLLPGAMVFLGDRAPDLGECAREAELELAVATDQNPGSSPLSSLAIAAMLAVTQMGLTVEEALRAITLGAANALGRSDIGTFEVGRRARFLVLSHPDSRALVYGFSEPTIAHVHLPAPPRT